MSLRIINLSCYIALMKWCLFTFDGKSSSWKCERCGVLLPHRSPVYRQHIPRLPKRPCPASDTPEARAKREAELAEATAAYVEKIGPSLPVKAAHYAAALLRWSHAGFPVRDDNDVEVIVSICGACEKYRQADESCSVCGCQVNYSPWPMVNKARMGGEVCPLGKWR